MINLGACPRNQREKGDTRHIILTGKIQDYLATNYRSTGCLIKGHASNSVPLFATRPVIMSGGKMNGMMYMRHLIGSPVSK